MSTKSVLLIGASGNLGTPILQALIADPGIDVTILSRESSTSTFPAGVPVKKADYNSHDSLVAAFKGHEVIVSNVATLAAGDQVKFVEAAVDAGVKRFYPTEFGSIASSDDPKLVTEWWDRVGFHGKYEVYLRLKELSDAGKIEWTLITNGPFFDWGLHAGFLGLKLKEKKITIYGSGNQLIATTNLAHIAKATAWTITHPEETKNKAVRFYSYKVSQNQVLEIVEKITGTKWAVERISIEDHIKNGEAGIKAGNPHAGYQVMQGLIFDEEDRFGSNYAKNEVPITDEQPLEKAIEAALKSVA
ncbi:hypothetical protein H072_7803 [Dactylellina haptotyla CBS 200.50]|uniref:NmrA-like domain-containing protein n=1 Tax=Dactylellina haptotyla (strain CBS 200.50) TaxID=1284197 RepID=S8A613_DACHA|nr:hypothetical protein H072_7803 [Dactylellina haptotyla CBS 200.50]